MSAPAPLARAILAQTEIELRLTSRRLENALVTILIPVVALVFFGSVAVLPTPAGRPVEFLLPGIIGLAIVATSFVSLGIATAYERHYGVLKRLGGSPLTRTGLVAAKSCAVLAIEVIQTLVLIAIAWLVLEWRPIPGANPVLLLAALVLGTATFAGLGLLLAGTLRAEATLAVANGLFLVTLLVGGTIVPIDVLPGVLAQLAGILPGAALTETLRMTFGADGDPLRPLLVLAAWGAGAIALTAKTFRWA